MMYFEMANWLCLMKWSFYLSLLATSSKYILNSKICMMGCFLDGPYSAHNNNHCNSWTCLLCSCCAPAFYLTLEFTGEI